MSFKFDENKRLVLSVNDEESFFGKPEAYSKPTEKEPLKKQKKKPGPKPKMTYDEQKNVFEEHKQQLYDLTGRRINKWSDLLPLLQEIGKKKNMSDLNVWVAAQRYGENAKYIDKNVSKAIEEVESQEDQEDPNFVAADISPTVSPDKTWTIAIDQFPDLKTKSKQEKYVAGLRMTLREIGWFLFKYPCNFEFEKIVTSGVELYAKEYCRLCKGVIEFQPIGNRTKLRVSSKGVDLNMKHTVSKAYVTGEYRSKVIQMLEKDTPGVVQSKLAHELKNRDDGICEILPTKSALTKMKYRANKRLRNIRDPSMNLSICKMSEESAYAGCIEQIGAKPFFVYYSTPLQKARTQVISRKKQTIISIDATGCRGKLPAESETSERTGKKKRCFYYALTVQGEKKSDSAYHMLSQNHTSVKIADWLTAWKSNHHSNINPLVIITDESAALLSALCQSFAEKRSMNDYLSQCFEHLENEGEAPKCYIRLDRSHVVATILRNKEFKKVFGKLKQKKHFYFRVIGFLLQQNDWKLIKDVMEKTITLAVNPNSSAIIKMMERDMLNLTKNHKIYRTSQDSDDPKQPVYDAKWNVKKSRFFNFFENMAQRKQEEVAAFSMSSSGSHDSIRLDQGLYAPDIVPTLVDIFSKIALTSCVMNKSFGLPIEKQPSSSASEANFRVVNRDLFGGKKRIGADGWLETHLKYLLGKSKADDEMYDDGSFENENIESELEYEPMSDVDEFASESETESESDGSFEDVKKKEDSQKKREDEFDDSVKHENWKGQNDDAKKSLIKFKQRSRFSILNPQYASVLPISLLSNQSTVKVRNKQIIISQGCAPNSLTHVFMAMYVDSEKVKAEIDATDDEFSNNIKMAINSRKIDSVYRSRAEFLVKCYDEYCKSKDNSTNEEIAGTVDKSKIDLLKRKLVRTKFFQEESSQIILLNCHINLMSLLGILCIKTPLFAVKESTFCSTCKVELKETRILPTGPVNINTYGVENLQKCLIDQKMVSNIVCPQCKSSGTKIRSPSRILFLDLENFDGLSQKVQEDRKFELKKVSDQITYGGIKFFFKAIIEHDISKHFIAHIRRPSGAWETYDDLKYTVQKTPKMVAGVMLVYLMEEDNEPEQETDSKGRNMPETKSEFFLE